MDNFPAEKIRVLVADDRTIFREVVRNLADQEPDVTVIGDASSGKEAVEKAAILHPDVLLLNLGMPHFSGLEVLKKLIEDALPVRAIVIADSQEKRQIVEALKLGARGVLFRHTPAQLLFKSIRAVAAGEYWVGHSGIHDLIDHLRTDVSREPQSSFPAAFRLTPREISIVGLIADGFTNKDSAHRFMISEQTVKHHLTSIFEKLGVSNRLELALLAMQERTTH